MDGGTEQDDRIRRDALAGTANGGGSGESGGHFGVSFAAGIPNYHGVFARRVRQKPQAVLCRA